MRDERQHIDIRENLPGLIQFSLGLDAVEGGGLAGFFHVEFGRPRISGQRRVLYVAWVLIAPAAAIRDDSRRTGSLERGSARSG